MHSEVVEPRRIRPLRRVEFDRLVETGAFEGERVELVRGVLVEMAPQGVPHANAVEVLNELLVSALRGRARVRTQLPFVVGDDSELEPDLAVLERSASRRTHPSRALLVVEVADSTLAFDRKVKAQLYAEAQVPEYWVVDTARRQVEVHTRPAGGTWKKVERLGTSATLRLRAFPDVELRVADLFPRA